MRACARFSRIARDWNLTWLGPKPSLQKITHILARNYVCAHCGVVLSPLAMKISGLLELDTRFKMNISKFAMVAIKYLKIELFTVWQPSLEMCIQLLFKLFSAWKCGPLCHSNVKVISLKHLCLPKNQKLCLGKIRIFNTFYIFVTQTCFHFALDKICSVCDLSRILQYSLAH